MWHGGATGHIRPAALTAGSDRSCLTTAHVVQTNLAGPFLKGRYRRSKNLIAITIVAGPTGMPTPVADLNTHHVRRPGDASSPVLPRQHVI
jgi:hypothetical protein